MTTKNREIARKAKQALARFRNHRSEFVEIGSGCYGSAHRVPGCPEIVIKVSDCREDQWRRYIKWAMATKSKHAPVVYALLEEKPEDSDDDGIFAVAMERLVPIYGYYEGLSSSRSVDRLRRSKHGCIEMDNWGYGSLKAFVKRIDKFRYTIGAWADLHKGNIMLRVSDDTIVVTDPIS